MKTVTTEHITQTTKLTDRSEQKKVQRVGKTRMGKTKTTGSKEGVIKDQLCYGCGSKEHKTRKCNKKNSIFVINN